MSFDEIDARIVKENLGIHDIYSEMSLEVIAQYLSAGILLPDEVRLAEHIVRRNRLT